MNRYLRSDLDGLLREDGLAGEGSFARRARVLDRLEEILSACDSLDGASSLKRDAEAFKKRLEAADQALFREWRAQIRRGDGRGNVFLDKVEACLGEYPRGETGYDARDMLLNGLLLEKPVPAETFALEQDMVFYQKTPARIIFQLADKARLGEGEVFCDLGSGLGQVAILFHLLTGAACRGIDIEPAYCAYASAGAADLGLKGLEFIAADARKADLSGPSVFFLYTPFRGRLLEEVLGRLETEARRRPLRIFTYGPCTTDFARQAWLKRLDQGGDNHFRLGEFLGSAGGRI